MMIISIEIFFIRLYFFPIFNFFFVVLFSKHFLLFLKISSFIFFYIPAIEYNIYQFHIYTRRETREREKEMMEEEKPGPRPEKRHNPKSYKANRKNAHIMSARSSFSQRGMNTQL
jgi:hypothetical protein